MHRQWLKAMFQSKMCSIRKRVCTMNTKKQILKIVKTMQTIKINDGSNHGCHLRDKRVLNILGR